MEKVLDEIYEEHSEQDAIREIMRRKRWNPEEMDRMQMQKAYASLVRKGFSYADIRRAFES